VRPRLLVGAVLAALCVPVLDPEQQLFWRDTQRFFYPFKLALAERLGRGELPLWDRWTESGVSVLGQLTPGLWHPATLLYVALPFPLAFKLNHLLALPAAALGALLLARRLGAGAWAAAVAALTYAGCGFLCAMTASNLPFALGHATLPLAVWAILRFTDAPGPSRLLLAAAVLGSCGLAGEPQSMLLAGLIAGTWALLGAGVRAAPRMLARLALCGACGVLLSAPATFPAAERLRLGDARRLEQAAGMFSLDVRRLPGLALPWAFDDTPQLAGAGSDTPYSEYFSGEPHVAFADSIALGLPALILAAFGGPALLAGAALFLLAAMGSATPVQWLAAHLIPGFALFRYPEKLVGPASLLLALAAATGAQRILADRIAARRALVAAAAAAGVLLALGVGIHLWHDELAAWLVAHGRTRAVDPAQTFAGALSRALLVEAGLAAGLAVACALRERRDLLAALVCAASSLLCGAGQLVTAPRELLEARPPLAELLVQRAGPSEGAWRIESDTEQSLVLPGLDARLRRAAWSAQVLAPRTNAVQRIESVSGYGSLEDERYRLVQAAAPGVFRAVLGVRFTVRMPLQLPQGPGWTQGPFRMWIHEQPVLPRAFLVAHAVRTAEPLAALRDPGFDPARDAVTSQVALDEPGPGGEAQMVRESPERIRVRVEAPGPRLLIVAEHFDPGWRARVDGKEAAVRRVDLCALGVELPAGAKEVELRYLPRGLLPGAVGFLATLAVLGALSVRRYRSAAAR
jgi:hypothetical protein